MPTTTSPSEHLSIGEVLATLRDEFPDITISKIRFLESQGLIDPERTPSGYRKFYGPDIDRLRWILHQQKENFLPLKVIKGRLEEAGPDELPTDAPAEAAADESGATKSTTTKAAGKGRARAASKSTAQKTAAAAKDADGASPSSRSKSGTTRATSAKAATKSRAKPKRPNDDAPTLELDDGAADDLEDDGDTKTMTRAELIAASGLTNAQVTELEEFGLLEPAGTGGDRILFDQDALVIATLAAGFAQHGIEARHLRMYRSFAEREATLYGQVIQGVLRQRNPEARARARADLVELAGMGRAMRSTFLRRAVDDLLTD